MCRLMAYIGPPRLIADVVLCKNYYTACARLAQDCPGVHGMHSIG